METSKKWFWILFDILVGAAVVTLLFGVLPMVSRVSSSYVPAHTIMVSAEGKTTATPDLAEVSFSVVTQGKSPADLSNTNNDKMTAVMKFVKSQGIADQDAKTTAYDLQPNYQYDRTSQRNYIIGYTLTQTIEVKIHDITKVADVLAGLAPLGVNQIGGVNFTFNDPDSITAIARADALAKAKAKAAEMAAESGMSLGAIVNLSESNYFPMAKAYGMGGYAAASSISPSLPPISAGTQDITDTVNVTYELK